ncbi:MAG: hypothetical protein NXH70_06810 [Hyphomonas sp.]|jgi:hypothetical protein|nr:hypothetical protein [Henriciella sp.]MBO6694089.1 hypothetical protein [Henriciella sp.]MCH9751136.1 hypothetical protein [Alphaproteobacteria bacterium]MCR9223766.1 hypothetical protein [Hyphomonas sp.]
MLKNMIKTCADDTGLTQIKAREAVGIVLNTAERQGSPLAEAVFRKMPGARTLSATTGADHGAATGVIARLIEQTPGGRRHVGEGMFASLHKAGLGHKQISQLLPAISKYMQITYGMEAFGHIGDLVVADMLTGSDRTAAAA